MCGKQFQNETWKSHYVFKTLVQMRKWKLFNVGLKDTIVLESYAALLKIRTLLADTNSFFEY